MSYKPITLDSVITIEKIVTVHYLEYTKDYVFTGEKHDFWEIAYVDKGEVGVVADGKGYTLKQGEAIFHKPLEYHNIWANNTYSNVVILSFVSKCRGMNVFKNKIIRLDNNDKNILSKIIKESELAFCEPLNIVDLKKMTKNKNALFGSFQLIKIYMEELLINLARKESFVSTVDRVSQITTELDKQEIVKKIIEFLSEDVTRPLTLDDVCAGLCFSKTYIKALFKEKMGVGIMQYYTTLKVDKAKRLISEGNLTFSEIAIECGFGSVHYFSRTFKKHTNMTPTEYSKSVKSMGIL